MFNHSTLLSPEAVKHIEKQIGGDLSLLMIGMGINLLVPSTPNAIHMILLDKGFICTLSVLNQNEFNYRICYHVLFFVLKK